MKRKERNFKEEDNFIQKVIQEEGERLQESLGESAYKSSEDRDVEADFAKILKEREALPYKKKSLPSMKGITKAAMVVLVVGACVLGFSLTSEATRMWWMDSFGWKIGDDGATKINNDANRDPADVSELDATAEIEEALGIKVPIFQYLPEQCVFSDYGYETITNRAIMNYKIEEVYMILNMVIGLAERAQSENYDGVIVSEERIINTFGEIELKEISNSNGDNYVMAEWNYEDAYYNLIGKISFEELKMIVENMLF